MGKKGSIWSLQTETISVFICRKSREVRSDHSWSLVVISTRVEMLMSRDDTAWNFHISTGQDEGHRSWWANWVKSGLRGQYRDVIISVYLRLMQACTENLFERKTLKLYESHKLSSVNKVEVFLTLTWFWWKLIRSQLRSSKQVIQVLCGNVKPPLGKYFFFVDLTS